MAFSIFSGTQRVFIKGRFGYPIIFKTENMRIVEPRLALITVFLAIFLLSLTECSSPWESYTFE